MTRRTLPIITALLLVIPWVGQAVADPPPIQVIFDLHADPFPQIPLPERTAIYEEWRDTTRWALDLCALYGARISFLSTGEFAEFALDDPNLGWPLIADLYASGGTIGVHSHRELQVGPHDWPQVSSSAPEGIVREAWADAIGMVDALVSAALGLGDPNDVRAVVASRGSHLPVEEFFFQELMGEYGLVIRQQGPEEEFYAYFGHYVLNPYRPAAWHFLEHDPDAVAVVSPTGTGLGRDGIHFGIYQDFRLPAAKANFLLELLNWLDDVYVAHTDRVWSFGWGLHPADILPGEPQRDAVEPMLAWLKQNFVDQPVAGLTAAEFSSSAISRLRYLEWEAAHPGAVPFSYEPTVTSWADYPYLEPVARYLVGANWLDQTTRDGVVVHRLEASADLGGFELFVAYPLAAEVRWADLSDLLAEPEVATVCPRTGLAPLAASDAVPVPPAGVILVAPGDRLRLANGDIDLDGDVDLTDLAAVLRSYGSCVGDPQYDPLADVIDDGCVDLADVARLLRFYGRDCR